MTNSDDINNTANTDRDSGYYAVDAQRVIQVFKLFQMRPSHFAASGKAGAQGVYYDAKKIVENRTGNKWGHHTARAIENFCYFTQSENETLLPWRELIEHKDFYDGKEGTGPRTGNLLLTENRLQLNFEAMVLARKQLALSQEQLAKKTALPIRFIEAIENGNWETITKGTAKIIAGALNVVEETLFSQISTIPKSDAIDSGIHSRISLPTIGNQLMKKGFLLAIIIGLVLWASYQFYQSSQNPDKLSASTKLSGCWNWSTGSYIVIDDDGTAHNGPFGANWKIIDIAKRRYRIVWPSFVDTLSLSTEGDSLSGTNNYGLPVTATRKSGEKTTLVGSWLWMSGVTINIRTDFSFTGGALKGIWRKAGNHWIIEWPLVDTVTLSKNGLNLKVKNQFGSVTAKRDIHCIKN